MANRNWASGGKIYSMHVMPVMLDCKFTVNSTDSAGYGITGLKGPTIANVFMHTSATAAAGSPNPIAGTIVVQFADNYNLSYTGFNQVSSINSGSIKIDNGATLTLGTPYVISTLGNATAAQWLAVGVPAGVTPAVGVSFIAIATGGGSGNTSTSRVSTAITAGVRSIELVGNASLSAAPNPGANQGYGASMIFQCYDDAGAVVAPANGSVISLGFLLSNSSVQIQGE